MILVRSLELGGAERQAAQLAVSLHNERIPVTVATFYAKGPLLEPLLQNGIPVLDLKKRGRWDIAGFAARLVRQVRSRQPTAILGYLPGPNIALALLRPLLPACRIVWGIRASSRDASAQDWFSRSTLRLEAMLARCADLIIVNSHAGAAHHQARGYPSERMRVISNGIDTDRFRFDPDARAATRGSLGYTEADLVIGCVGRLDPIKGHGILLDAFRRLHASAPQARLLMIGDGSERVRASLVQQAAEASIGDAVKLLPGQPDIARYMSACDIAVSGSLAEGFPNVIAEAMACERVCVATDAGDAARIVGDTGIIVPPGDAEALGAALATAAQMPLAERERRGRMARARIVEHFGAARLARDTLDALESLR